MAMPPRRGQPFTLDVVLIDTANRPYFRNAPTLAAGDVAVSKDGGAFVNIASLPTTNTYQVRVALSGAEMTADRVCVLFRDVAGAQWDDLMVELFTTQATPVALAQAQPAKPNDTIEILRGDTLDQDVTRLGNITARTNLWFTVKKDKDDLDSAAQIQIDETTGLLRIVGTAGTAGNGSITVTDAITGNITIALAAIETAKLPLTGRFYYDIQYEDATMVRTLAMGLCCITGDVTRAT